MKSRVISFLIIVAAVLLLLVIRYWPIFLGLVFFLFVGAIISAILINCSRENELNSIDISQVDAMGGLEFENYVASLLRKNGYRNVCVTKSSGDFGVDITAYKDGLPWAFQCKRYSTNLGVKPVQEIFSGAAKYHAKKAVVVTNSYFTGHAKELARELDVLLWDRDKLLRLMGSGERVSELKDNTSQNYSEINRPSNLSFDAVNMRNACYQTGSKMDVGGRVDSQTQGSAGVYNGECEDKDIEENTSKHNIGGKPVAVNSVSKICSGGNNMKGPIQKNQLPNGRYVIGRDIPVGVYDFEALHGSGIMVKYLSEGTKEDNYFQRIGVEKYDNQNLINVDCREGEILKIPDNVVVAISRSNKVILDFDGPENVRKVGTGTAFNGEKSARRIDDERQAATLQFTPTQVLEMMYSVDETVLSKLAEQTSIPFTAEQVEEIYLQIEDDALKNIIVKALDSGARFSPAQVLEMMYSVDETVLSKMAVQTSIPFTAEQLEEIYLEIEDDTLNRIILKALDAGARFTPAQVLEMMYSVDETVLSKMAVQTSIPFTVEQLEDIQWEIDDDSFKRISVKKR